MGINAAAVLVITTWKVVGTAERSIIAGEIKLASISSDIVSATRCGITSGFSFSTLRDDKR